MEPTVINYLLGQYQPHRDTLLMLFRLNAPYAATPNPETKRDMSDPPEDLEVGRESDWVKWRAPLDGRHEDDWLHDGTFASQP